MGRLARTDGLSDVQTEIVATVRSFVDKEILPVATELEHADEYPTQIVEGPRSSGCSASRFPSTAGSGSRCSRTPSRSRLARGWMSVSGIVNTHFIVAWMLVHHGTDEQRQRLLPLMATGETRGAFSMSEPGCGSDVAAIRTKATRDGDGYRIDGQKMWLTNGGRPTWLPFWCVPTRAPNRSTAT